MASAGFVLDNSVSIAWCFADEQPAYARAVLRAIPSVGAVVPSLWPLEAANVLLRSERHGRITQADSTTFLHLLESLPIRVDEETAGRAFAEVVGLARSTGLTSYDASYLELAMRRGLPIATLDEKLSAAAKVVGVSLFAA